MARHACPRVEAFHQVCTETYVERRLDPPIGPGVVMAVDVDRVIKMDAGLFPLGICIGLAWERPAPWALARVKQRLA